MLDWMRTSVRRACRFRHALREAVVYRIASSTNRLVQVCSSISFALVAALSPTAWRKISCTCLPVACRVLARTKRVSGILQRVLDVLKFELRVGALLEDLRGFHGMIGNVVARLDHAP